MLLVDPRFTYAGLYPFPVAHPYDGYSMVDFESPNLDEWPKFGSVTGQVCILAPGDILYVPRAWWLHTQALPDEPVAGGTAGGASTPAASTSAAASEHTTLELALRPGARIRPAEAVPPAVGRVVEELAVEGEGVAGARAWLSRLAARTEMAAIDLATVQGYKRIRLSTQIRDEVELTLGRGVDVSAFLAALIDRRMVPTPWLNVDFREPLYLKGARARVLCAQTVRRTTASHGARCSAHHSTPQTCRCRCLTCARSGSAAFRSCLRASLRWKGMRRQ